MFYTIGMILVLYNVGSKDSQVKYLGIPVGSVRELHINPYNFNEIIVTVAIDPDIPIREDVEANLIAIGITGIKIIELTAGTQRARNLEPGSYIQPGKSVTDEFVQRAVVITEKIESVLDNMLEFTEDDTRMHIVSFIEEAHTTILKINRMLDENHERLEQIVTHADTLHDPVAISFATTRRRIRSGCHRCRSLCGKG